MFGLGGRRARRRDDAAATADDIRRTIVRLDDQRRHATSAAGRALVSRAEVRRACAEQLQTLAAASAEARRAELLTRRVAASARDEDAAETGEYERTAAALGSAQDVLAAAAGPIEALLAGAEQNVGDAQRVLRRTRDVLDEQVRTQVGLLHALERSERARIVRDRD